MIDEFGIKEVIMNTNVISANAHVISPLILGLSLDSSAPYSQGAPSGYFVPSILESAMPHTTAMIARRARFMRLKEEHSDTEDTSRWKRLTPGG